MRRIAMATALWLLPASLSAQWLNFKTPGIPRTADGKPDLTAPAPRTPDGKPDLSGLWRTPSSPYMINVIQDTKDEAVFKPAAEALFQERLAAFDRDWPPSLSTYGTRGIRLSPYYSVLNYLPKYAGTYELREGPAGSRPLTISLVHGRLYMGAEALNSLEKSESVRCTYWARLGKMVSQASACESRTLT
jgi:hypothetical protein